MHNKTSSFPLLILSVFLLFSCTNRQRHAPVVNDYSAFQQGAILQGSTTDGQRFYLIREDSTQMSGICFVDNKRAITEIITFCADSIGRTTFGYGNDTFSGQITVNQSSMEIKLSLPQITALKIAPQTIYLNGMGTIPEDCDCLEHYKNPVYQNIVPIKEREYGRALGHYTSEYLDPAASYKDLRNKLIAIEGKLAIDWVLGKTPKERSLTLDIYHHENTNIKSPLLLFIHGGAFALGDKENDMQRRFTEYFVKRGFIVASINYRMGTIFTEHPERTFYHNVQDTRAALRFLMHNKVEFNIDDEQIYLAGSSAGGIIALTTAFLDSDEIPAAVHDGILIRKELGGLDDLGNDFKDPVKITGVISMWGAVSNLKILNNPVATLLFHGTADDVVPCGSGMPFKNFMGVFHGLSSRFFSMHGSESIYNYLKNNTNNDVEYIRFPGYKHDVHLNSDGTLSANMDTICKKMRDFLYQNISKTQFNYSLSGNTNVGRYDAVPVYRLSNIGNASVQWQINGGFITNQTNDSVQVIWYNTTQTGKITVCITNDSGISCKKELNVNIN